MAHISLCFNTFSVLTSSTPFQIPPARLNTRYLVPPLTITRSYLPRNHFPKSAGGFGVELNIYVCAYKMIWLRSGPACQLVAASLPGGFNMQHVFSLANSPMLFVKLYCQRASACFGARLGPRAGSGPGGGGMLQPQLSRMPASPPWILAVGRSRARQGGGVGNPAEEEK